MINLNFLPSAPIARYTMRLFVTRTLAVLASLVLILMTLDLLGESGKILAAPGNGQAQLWHYVVLRVPMLTAKFLPFSALLGTLIAFAGLNANSEVIAMKRRAISAHQILAPLIIASVGVAAVTFVFSETVVVNSARAVAAVGGCRLQGDPGRERGAQQRLGSLPATIWSGHGVRWGQAATCGWRMSRFTSATGVRCAASPTSTAPGKCPAASNRAGASRGSRRSTPR